MRALSCLASISLIALVACQSVSPTPTPTPTPFPNGINPSLLCPAVTCPGYNDVTLGPLALAYMSSGITPNRASLPNALPEVLRSSASPPGESWPSISSLAPGVYSLSYAGQDKCGAPVTTTASLEVRCNNPPVPVIGNTDISVDTYTGAEIILDAFGSFDPDANETAILQFYWCLVSKPVASNGPPVATGYSDVSSFLRVPDIGGPLAGYALLRPDTSGVYTVSVVISDGCNFVSADITVTVSLSCKPTVASIGSVNGPVPKAQWTAQDPHTGGTVAWTSYPGYTIPTVYGCTWPGAANFNSIATNDDGSCFCDGTNNTWTISSAPGSYKRVASAVNVTTVATGSTLTFIQPNTSSTLVANASCSVPNGNSSTLSSSFTGQLQDALPRPSTSLGVSYSYAVTEEYSYTIPLIQNDTYLNIFDDITLCAVSVSPMGPSANSVFTAAPVSTDRSQCIGYYTAVLSSSPLSPAPECSSLSDSLPIPVSCPADPAIDILCDVELYWDGNEFVPNPGTSGGWVGIDTSMTVFSPTAVYALNYTTDAVNNTYLGAGPTGPQAGEISLAASENVSLSTAGNVITAAFLPTRGSVGGSTYTVTLSGNDGCNPIANDSVTVTTQCVGIDSAPQAVLISYSGAAAGVNLTVNGGYSPAGVSGVLDTNLNYGVRVSSRPVLPYGDVGVVASPSGPSYECMLGNGWNTIGGPSVPFDYPTITAPLRLTGSYQLEVTLLDACAQGTAMSSQLNVTACVDTVSNIQPGDSVNSVIWQDHAFPFFDFQQVKNAPVSVTVYYSWFLTAGPAGVLVYNTTAGNAPIISPNATTCLAFPPTGGFPAAAGSYGAQIGVDGLSGIAVLRQVNPLDPNAPIQNSVTASTLSYQPLYTGSYSFTLQAIGPCDLKYFTLSVVASCNGPPRFLCLDGTSTCAPNPAAGYVSGFTSSVSTWNCMDNRFAPVFMNAFGNAGADNESATDSVTYTFNVVPTPATGNSTSWWSAALVPMTLTWSFTVPYSFPSAIFADSTGFPTIAAAAVSSLNSAVSAVLGDASRVFTTNQAVENYFAGNPYANASNVSPLGVNITGGCFVPGQGRQFTAVGTFALLPPTYFRAWGVIANPLSNNPATRGYSRTYSRTADYRPLGVFLAEFSAQASSIASLASVLTPFPGSALSDVTAPALTVGASIPNAFIYSAVSQNQGHTDTLFTSSFLPDVPGTYSLVATLTDDCPSSTPVTLSGGSGLTVTVVGLSQCGDPTTPFGNGVSMSQSPATVNGDFVNRQLGFGTPWNYTVTSTQGYGTVDLNSSATFSATCTNLTGGACTGVPSGYLPIGFTFTNDPLSTESVIINIPSLAGGTLTATLGATGFPQMTPGSELHVGCGTSPTKYFTTVPTYNAGNAPGTVSMLIPASCYAVTPSPISLVLTRFATVSAGFPWTVTNLNLTSHPSGYQNFAPSCPLSYSFSPSGSGVEEAFFSLLPTSSSPAPPTGTFLAGSLSQGLMLTTAGAITGPLPAGSLTFTTAYTLSYPFPSWVLSSPCSFTSSPSSQATLQCPLLAPTLALSSNLSTFNISLYNLNTVALALGGSFGVASAVMDSDVTFFLTGAPTGSAYDARGLASFVFLPQLMANFPNYTGITCGGKPVTCTPNPPRLNTTMLAYNNTAATDGMTYAVVEEFSAQLNTSTLVYLDPANINITLLNEAPPLPSDFNLIGGYGQYYLRQLATAHFLPDLMSATGYTFIALVDDGCNPPKYSNTVNLSSTACPSIVVKAGLFPGSPAPAFTDSGPGRVTLLGSTNLSALLVDADHFSGYSWAVTAPGGLTVTVEDAGTLQPSFVPPVAGGYSATLTISLSPLCSYNATVTVTVGCSISSPPPLVASIAQSEPIPLSAPSQLTIVSAGGGGTVYWLGAPNDGALNATWAPVPSVDYTCVTNIISVGVVAVYPPAITNLGGGAVTQTLYVQLSIGGQSALPAGLLNILSSGTDPSGSAIVIRVGSPSQDGIGGVPCTFLFVLSASAGTIACSLSQPVPPTVAGTFSYVYAAVLGVGSDALSQSLPVQVSNAPFITGVSVSGSTLTLTGTNLAFGPTDTTPAFSAGDTRVFVGTAFECSGITATGIRTPFSSQLRVQCTLPAVAAGDNLNVSISVGFRDQRTRTVYTTAFAYASWSVNAGSGPNSPTSGANTVPSAVVGGVVGGGGGAILLVAILLLFCVCRGTREGGKGNRGKAGTTEPGLPRYADEGKTPATAWSKNPIAEPLMQPRASFGTFGDSPQRPSSAVAPAPIQEYRPPEPLPAAAAPPSAEPQRVVMRATPVRTVPTQQ